MSSPRSCQACGNEIPARTHGLGAHGGVTGRPRKYCWACAGPRPLRAHNGNRMRKYHELRALGATPKDALYHSQRKTFAEFKESLQLKLLESVIKV